MEFVEFVAAAQWPLSWRGGKPYIFYSRSPSQRNPALAAAQCPPLFIFEVSFAEEVSRWWPRSAPPYIFEVSFDENFFALAAAQCPPYSRSPSRRFRRVGGRVAPPYSLRSPSRWCYRAGGRAEPPP